MKAIAYVRKSQKSKERTVSLEEQEAAIRSYVAGLNGQVVTTVTHDGISGGNRGRLVTLKEQVTAQKADAVVVYHHDRFARDVAGMLDSVRAFAKSGVAVHVVGRGQIDVKSASGFLTNSMEGVVAEHYRLIIGEKTSGALANLARSGHVAGGTTYGYRNVRSNGHVTREIIPQEAQAVQRFFVLASEGAGYYTIARTLAAEGFPAPVPRIPGKTPEWSGSAVRRIVRRPLYRGVQTWAGGIAVDSPALRLIPEPLWEQVQARLRRKTVNGHPVRSGAPKYLLSGLGRCSVCQGPMIVKESRLKCGTRHQKGTPACPNALTMPLDIVEIAVLESVADHLTRPEILDPIIAGLLAEAFPPTIRGGRHTESAPPPLKGAHPHPNPPGAAYCNQCGAHLLHGAPQVKQQPPPTAPQTWTPAHRSRAEAALRETLEQWTCALEPETTRAVFRALVQGAITFSPKMDHYSFSFTCTLEPLLASGETAKPKTIKSVKSARPQVQGQEGHVPPARIVLPFPMVRPSGS